MIQQGTQPLLRTKDGWQETPAKLIIFVPCGACYKLVGTRCRKIFGCYTDVGTKPILDYTKILPRLRSKSELIQNNRETITQSQEQSHPEWKGKIPHECNTGDLPPPPPPRQADITTHSSETTDEPQLVTFQLEIPLFSALRTKLKQRTHSGISSSCDSRRGNNSGLRNRRIHRNAVLLFK